MEGAPCLVLAVPPAKETSPKLGAMLLSAMQVDKGLKKGEETWLTTFKEDREDGSNDDAIPLSIQNVLEEFKDVMPPELPRNFHLGMRWTLKLNWSREQSHMSRRHIRCHPRS